MWTVESEGKVASAVPVESLVQLEAEGRLEDLLVRSPDILKPNLRLVGRQNPTKSGFLDLLGIDEDGRLVVFELKRGTLTREAVAQIVDYTSSLASMTAEALAQHISDRSGSGGVEKIDDFDAWYSQIFPNSPGGYGTSPSMVLVGLGADEQTQRMTAFLRQSGLDISLLTFYAFKSGDKIMLAKHVNVQPPEPEGRMPARYTKTSNMQALNALAEKCAVRALLESAIAFVRSELPAYEWPYKSSYSFSLMERTESGTPTYRVYVSVYLDERRPKKIQLFFMKRAVDAAQRAFDELQRKAPIEFMADSKSDGLYAWVTSVEWEALKEPLRPLLASVVSGWKTKRNET